MREEPCGAQTFVSPACADNSKGQPWGWLFKVKEDSNLKLQLLGWRSMAEMTLTGNGKTRASRQRAGQRQSLPSPSTSQAPSSAPYTAVWPMKSSLLHPSPPISTLRRVDLKLRKGNFIISTVSFNINQHSFPPDLGLL